MLAERSIDAVALISSLAQCSKSFDEAERWQLARAAQVCKGCLRTSIRGTVCQSPHGFAFRSTSTDGTPITISDKIKLEMGHGRIFYRSGRACHEFLVGVPYYRVWGESGGYTDRALPLAPCPCCSAKSGGRVWCYASRRKHVSTARAPG